MAELFGLIRPSAERAAGKAGITACFLAGSLIGGKWKASIRPAAKEQSNNKMKKSFLLCAVIGAAIVLSSCANQHSSATASDTSRRGLVDPGSVAPVSSGPTSPHASMQKFKP